MRVESPRKQPTIGPELVAIPDPIYINIRDIVYRISGIYQSEQKLYLLIASCARRMSAVGVERPSEYFERLTCRATGDVELRQLLNEITIGETYMFRHPAHLQALHEIILPQLMKSKSAIGLKRIRIWSAGCSTGEEPYTLAIFLREEFEKERQFAGWNFDILATDLNSNSLDAARAGIYGEYALRNVSEPLRWKYFREVADNKLEANQLLKSLIRFDRVNLSDDSKMLFLKGIDLIFCYNVLIYFDLSSKRRVVQHFFSNLVPGGYFFLGHAESLFHVDKSFQLVHFPGTTGYWKPSAGGRP